MGKVITEGALVYCAEGGEKKEVKKEGILGIAKIRERRRKITGLLRKSS